MMSKLYKRNELLFSVLWIVLYVVLLSFSDGLSDKLGVQKSITAAMCILLSGGLCLWLWRNALFGEYGLCRPRIPAAKLLYYLPLIILASCNLWGGPALNASLFGTLCYVVSMLLVGFLEEIIFRGLLFKAMCKDNVRTAVIVSSVTFGVGHIVNLFNGSGMDLLSNILQICSAVIIGFLFTYIFYKTESLWACILTHGVLNALGAFADQTVDEPLFEIITTVILCAVSLLYLCYLVKAVGLKSQNL